MGSRFDKSLGGGLYMAISPDVLIAYLIYLIGEKQPEIKKDDLIVVTGNR